MVGSLDQTWSCAHQQAHNLNHSVAIGVFDRCQECAVRARTAKPSAVRSQRLCLRPPYSAVTASLGCRTGSVDTTQTPPVRPMKNNAHTSSLKRKSAPALHQASEGKRG